MSTGGRPIAIGIVVIVLLATGVAGLVGAVNRHSTAVGAAHVSRRGAAPTSSPSPATTEAPSGVPVANGATAGSSGLAGAASAASGAATAANLGQATSSATLPPLPSDATGQSARVEETGTLGLLVPGSDIGSDIGRLMTMAEAVGGFVANSQDNSAGAGSPAQGTVTLQVPQSSFDNVLAQARSVGKVSSLTTSATDVTGQYVDLQARITALEDSRQQYLTIMTEATSIGDILSVQSQLDDLQSQLEQLQGQLQVLDNETTYASLTVNLSQKVIAVTSRPESGLASAWHAAVSGFVAGFEGVIRVAGPLLFALMLIVALVLLGRWAWHARRRSSFT